MACPTIMTYSHRWYIGYLAASWLSNFGQGLLTTVVGPTQHYLAQNVGVDVGEITFVWTAGFIGFLIGSIISGLVFKRFFTTDAQKLLYLFVNMMSTGLLMMSLPFLHSLSLLSFLRALQNVFLGSFITADASLIVFTMGPTKSGPFTNALHALTATGFLSGSLLVKPFLPDSFRDTESICSPDFVSPINNSSQYSYDLVTLSTIYGLNNFVWPYLCSGLWCCVASTLYLLCVFLPYEMPRYTRNENEAITEGSEERKKSQNISHKTSFWSKAFLCLIFIYYAISCGIERIFQPMAFTIGICGPLKLNPNEAVLIDTMYNGGFVVGRISSILIAKMLKPFFVIILSLIGCFIGSVLLVTLSENNLSFLYIGTCILGFFVSMQFGSAYSWLAQKMDITGILTTLVFLGCGFGSSIFPPLSGYVFTSHVLGSNGIMTLTLIVVLFQILEFFATWLISKKISSAQ